MGLTMKFKLRAISIKNIISKLCLSLISFSCGYLIVPKKDKKSAGTSSLQPPASEPITLTSADLDERSRWLKSEIDVEFRPNATNQFTFANPELEKILTPLLKELGEIKDFRISEVERLARRIEEYPNATLMIEALGQISVDNGFADKLIIAAGEKVIGYEVLVPSIARKSVLNGCVESVKRNIDLQKDEYLKAAYYSEVANFMLQLHLAGIQKDVEVPEKARPYYEALIFDLPTNSL